jgi:hypothetical protein
MYYLKKPIKGIFKIIAEETHTFTHNLTTQSPWAASEIINVVSRMPSCLCATL